jgi:hypothetical protein
MIGQEVKVDLSLGVIKKFFDLIQKELLKSLQGRRWF